MRNGKYPLMFVSWVYGMKPTKPNQIKSKVAWYILWTSKRFGRKTRTRDYVKQVY